jgi:hypothetical protein
MPALAAHQFPQGVPGVVHEPQGDVLLDLLEGPGDFGGRPGQDRGWRRSWRRGGAKHRGRRLCLEGSAQGQFLFQAQVQGRCRHQLRLAEDHCWGFLDLGLDQKLAFDRDLFHELGRQLPPFLGFFIENQIDGRQCRRRGRLFLAAEGGLAHVEGYLLFLHGQRKLLLALQRDLLLQDQGRRRRRGRRTGFRPRLWGGSRRGHQVPGVGLVGDGGIVVAAQTTDLGQGQTLLDGLGRKPLLLVDLAEVLACLQMVGEAGDDGLELVDRLVHQPILPEHAALGQVLVDELLVLAAQGTGHLDGWPSRRRGRGCSRGRNGRRPRCTGRGCRLFQGDPRL